MPTPTRALLLVLLCLPSLTFAAGRGVPQDGYPSWDERTVQVYVNRARADPAADLAGCASGGCAEWACYAPSAPVVWDYNLNRSSRFHSSNLGKTSSPLQHDSPCVLVSNVAQLYPPNGTCDGSESCACQPATLHACNPSSSPGQNPSWPTCTDPWTRIGLFGGGGMAENAAEGYGDPRSVFYAWLWESDGDSSCGWRYTNGHRANILGGASALGTGRDGAFWTQDFGGGSPTGSLIAGSHEPQAGGGSVELRANWYDAAAPRDARVDIDGACSAMALERGQGGNATYLASLSLDASCHRYVFVFKDASGNTVLLPEQGSYGIGDPASCADWDPSAPILCDGSSGSIATSTSSGATSTGTTSTGTTSSGATGGTTSTGTSSGSGASTTGSAAASSAASSTSGTTGSTSTAGTSSAAGSSSGRTTGSGLGNPGTTSVTSGAGGGPATPPSPSSVSGGCTSAPGLELFALLAPLALRRRRATSPARCAPASRAR